MKAIFKYLAISAVAVVSFVACQQDIQGPVEVEKTNGENSFKFYASTGDVSTKATLTPNADETTFEAAWEDADAMALDTYGTGVVNDQPVEFAAIGTASWDATEQAFEATYEPDVTVPAEQYSQWTYKAFYPWKELSFGSERTQDGNNFNSEYDLMYGTLQTTNCEIGKNADGSPIVIPMNRLTAIAYYHIQDANAPDEDVVSATLTVDANKVIAAESVEISADGTTITPSNGTNSITITFDEGTAPKATNFQLWFNLLTETIGEASAYNVIVDIETTGHTAKLTSKSARNFTAGKLNRAKISSLTWTEKPTISKGPEYTLATSSDLRWNDMSTALEYNDMSWVPAVVDGKSGASVQAYDASRGAHFGSANTGVTEMTFTGTGYSTYCQSATACGISAITVNVGAKNGETVTGVVTVGGVAMSPASDGSDSYLAANNVAGAISFYSADLLLGDIVIDLTLSNSGALYVKDIIINPDSRISPEFTYSTSSYTAVVNGSLDTPTLSYVSGFEGTVTYAIGENDNPNVANVNATTGAVTIGSELGDVTVTASFAGNETYKSAQASYTIHVIADPNTIESKTIAQFIELADAEKNYRLTGTVTSAIQVGSNYNRFTLTDDSGSIVVYKLDDVTEFVEGDIVTIHGKYELYQNTNEVVEGVYESHITTPKISVSTTSIVVSDSETSASFNIVADAGVAWSIDSDNPDLSFSPASGTGNAEITVSLSANTESTDRTATISISSNTENVYKNREISFTQAGRVGGKPTTVDVPSSQSFVYDNESKTLSATYSNVTITQAAPDGTPVNSNYKTTSTLRVYQNNTLTFESDYYITDIKFTHSGSYNGATISPDSGVYNGTTEAWTGQTKKVVLTMGSQFRPQSITITYLDPNATIENPILTVDDDFELVVGQTKTLTVSTNSDGVISYQSSNTAIATVIDGVVTAVAPGTATITVDVAQAEWYNAASKTVVATVVAKAIESISVAGLKVNYVAGNDFNESCTVTANYNDGTSAVVNAGDYTMTVTKDNVVVTTLTSLAAGTYYATVTYEGVSSSPIKITVSNGGGSAKTTLTNANIVSAGAASNSYGSWTFTDSNNNSYSAYAIKNQHSNATSAYHYLQIKKYASNTAYYIHIPELGTKITSIKMTVSGSSQPMTGGGNGATLYFSASNSTSTTGTGVASGTGASSVTIDCSSLNLNNGYITASGAVRIWDIEISYEN